MSTQTYFQKSNQTIRNMQFSYKIRLASHSSTSSIATSLRLRRNLRSRKRRTKSKKISLWAYPISARPHLLYSKPMRRSSSRQMPLIRSELSSCLNPQNYTPNPSSPQYPIYRPQKSPDRRPPKSKKSKAAERWYTIPGCRRWASKKSR